MCIQEFDTMVRFAVHSGIGDERYVNVCYGHGVDSWDAVQSKVTLWHVENTLIVFFLFLQIL